MTLETTASKTIYPYGLSKATDLDPQYSNPSASLFVLGVGRSGNIVAAKQIPLHSNIPTGNSNTKQSNRATASSDIAFPYTFELTSADLLPPLTEEAFRQGSDAKDDIALTALLTKGDKIAEFTGVYVCVIVIVSYVLISVITSE